MRILYPLLLSFTIIFFAELGDKTQIMVLSFSTKRLNSLSNFIFYGFSMEVIYRGFIFIIWRKAAFWNYVRIISITDVSGHLIAILLLTALCLTLL